MKGRHDIFGAFASLPLEGRDRGRGSIGETLNHPLPNPPLKGEGSSTGLMEVCP